MKSCLQIPLLKLGPHGGTRVLVEFANYMAAHDYDVRILTAHGTQDKKYDFHPNVEVREITFSLGHRYADYLLFFLVSPFLMRRGVLIANYFVTFYPVRLASVLFGCPYLYLVQDIETWFSGPSGIALNFLCRLTWNSRRMISVYAHVSRELKRLGIPLYGEVQAGVGESFFRQTPLTEEKSFDLVVFPRREPWKRTDLLKKIITLYRQRHGSLSVLCVFQDTALVGQFEPMGCKELCPKTETELIGGFDRSRVTLFTSSREGLGLPPLEGMARGLPAVVYENGGSAVYMKHNENGFIIADGDEDGAVDALHRLLSDPPLYESMGRAARVTAQKISTEQACRDLEKLTNSLLRPKDDAKTGY